jgi:CheY-like chemotaxis protein
MLVDDDPNDILLMKLAFDAAGLQHPVAVLHDGEEAIRYLEGTGEFRDRSRYPIPCMMLIDFKMPKLNGIEVTEWVRHHPALKKLIVIMISSSGLHPDIEAAYEAGVNCYVTKPSRLDQRTELILALKSWWLDRVEFSSLCRPAA